MLRVVYFAKFTRLTSVMLLYNQKAQKLTIKTMPTTRSRAAKDAAPSPKATTPSTSSTNVLLGCFSSLFVSQLATRIISFCINLLVTRYLTLDEYGLQAVQFELLNTAILQLSREGFRRTALRAGKARASSLLPFASLVLAIGVVVDVCVCGLWLTLTSTSDATYRHAIVLQGVAAYIELLSEPLYLLSQAQQHFHLRARAETAATLTKTLTTFILLQTHATAPILAFCWAQVAFGIATVVVFVWAYGYALLTASLSHAGQQGMALLTRMQRPHPPPGAGWGVWWSFTVQAGEKLLLAKGSSIVITVAMTPHQQGVYGLVNNLGSLVVRTLLFPFEEATFAAFSSTGDDDDNKDNVDGIDTNINHKDNDDDDKNNRSSRSSRAQNAKSTVHTMKQPQLQQHAALLAPLLRGITCVGLLSAVFGSPYAATVIQVLYPQWATSEAPDALGLYSVYVLLLAVNGVLEAFVHATANASALFVSNVVLVLSTVAHAGASVWLAHVYGVAGLLFADALNMVLRIAYSLAYTCWLFQPLRNTTATIAALTPAWPLLVTCATAAVGGWVSSIVFLGSTPLGDTVSHMVGNSGQHAGLSLAARVKQAPCVPLVSGVSDKSTWYTQHQLWVHLALHVAVGAQLVLLVSAVVWMTEGRSIVSAMRKRRGGAGEEKKKKHA